MNYLAHIYLSGDSEEIILGNFIADGVKGNTLENYNQGIKNGIILHRLIDKFTDNHSLVLESKKRLYSQFHKYAGVITDVFYDHFLAVKWKEYHSVEFSEYIFSVYDLLQKNHSILPVRFKVMLPYMVKQNWLFNYSNIEGIDKALKGLARRTTFVSGMENAAAELRNNYELYENDFDLFFPKLREFVKGKRVG